MEVKTVPLKELHHDPANPRQHDDRNMDAITSSLKEFGQVEPLVVQKGTGKVIGGNGRLTAMRDMGLTEATIVEVEADDARSAALSIALNRTAELAAWSDEDLAKLLSSLQQDADIDHLVTGFTEQEIADLVASVQGGAGGTAGLTDPDDIPEPPDDATTQPGDLWVMGEHRLLCGDSAREDHVDALLNSATIDMINMDPPYNVKVEPRSNNAIAASGKGKKQTHHQKLDVERHPNKAHGTHRQMRAKDRQLQNDFVTDDQFQEMLKAWFGNAARVTKAGGSFYIWGGYANLANYPGPIEHVGFYFSQGVVWDKQHPVLTRKDFMGAYEICFYGWKKGAAHEFYGPNNASDLWSIKKLTHSKMVHLTEKPVELAQRAIEYSSKAGHNVLDLFGGSGSTMIACEQTGRHAYLMEVDPWYCDVIVKRWEEFTGQRAERHEGVVEGVTPPGREAPEETDAAAAAE